MEFWIFIGIVVLVVVYGISIYNRLIDLRNRVKNGFSQIDVQLTRRYDLIPNLVEAVKGYMKQTRQPSRNWPGQKRRWVGFLEGCSRSRRPIRISRPIRT